MRLPFNTVYLPKAPREHVNKSCVVKSAEDQLLSIYLSESSDKSHGWWWQIHLGKLLGAKWTLTHKSHWGLTYDTFTFPAVDWWSSQANFHVHVHRESWVTVTPTLKWTQKPALLEFTRTLTWELRNIQYHVSAALCTCPLLFIIPVDARCSVASNLSICFCFHNFEFCESENTGKVNFSSHVPITWAGRHVFSPVIRSPVFSGAGFDRWVNAPLRMSVSPGGKPLRLRGLQCHEQEQALGQTLQCKILQCTLL